MLANKTYICNNNSEQKYKIVMTINMSEIVFEKSRTTKVSEIMDKMEIDGKVHLSINDRRIAMNVAGQMKRFCGKEFTTTVKGQPSGKFAVWRIK